MKTKAKATYTAKVVLRMSMDDAKVLRRGLWNDGLAVRPIKARRLTRI